MLGEIIAMQHTSNDVYAYAEIRRKCRKYWAFGAERWHVMKAGDCIFLQRTLHGFSTHGAPGRGVMSA